MTKSSGTKQSIRQSQRPCECLKTATIVDPLKIQLFLNSGCKPELDPQTFACQMFCTTKRMADAITSDSKRIELASLWFA